MAIDYTALGTRIGNHRVKANMSQEDLGAFSNVSNKHISNIELGKAKPSLEALRPQQIPNFIACFWTATQLKKRF